MSDTAKLLEAFKNNNFQEAREILKDKVNIPESLEPYERIRLFELLIKGKAFDIILFFFDHRLIETDLYEYQKFSNTLIRDMFLFLKEDKEDMGFLDDVLSRLENIDEPVDGQTLISYVFEVGAGSFLLRRLIAGGCDPVWVNNAEQTYLHQVARNNSIRLELALAYASILIDAGVDVNATDIVKKTALYYTIDRHKLPLVDLLLENGAQTNLPDNANETGFYKAIVDQQSLDLYVKFREYESPDFTISNNNGETILFQYLKRIGRPAADGMGLLDRLIQDGADFYAPSIYYGKEKTPAALLAELPFVVFENVLKQDVIDISHLDSNGNSILHQVCAYDVNYDQEVAKDTYRKVKLLIEKGADVNQTNNADQTAATLALTDNLKAKTVELLIKNK
jgi:ankyrin repeat protein